MDKQKLFWVVLIFVFILSFSYFLYQRYVPEKSNITANQTEQSMQKLKKQYNTKELIIVFKNGVSKSKANEIISEFNGEIIEYLPEIQNYRVRIKKDMTPEELLYLVENLNQRKEISLAVFNETVDSNKDSNSFFNNTKIENNKLFDKALNTYNKPVNVFYSKDGSHTFLYPSTWDVEKQGKLVEKNKGKELTYVLKKSQVDMYEDVIQKYIKEEEKKGFSLDGEIEEFEQDHLIITKWIMKKDGIQMPRSLIQGDNFYCYFVANEKVPMDEFSLVIHSFIVNKNPLKK